MSLEDARKRRAQRLIEEAFPGATLAVELEPLPEPPIMSERARQRALVRRQIVSCEACELRAGCRAPVPFSGPLSPSFVAVSEAPGVDEDVRGEPFVGRPGKLLKKMLKEVGFSDGEMMFAHAANCYPNEKGKVRLPSDDELAACRHNLLAQLEQAHTRYVLFCGATALSAFRDDLKVTQTHGMVFIWDSRYVVMPVHHPAAVLRNMDIADTWRKDLRRWKDIVREELDPMLVLGSDFCVRCHNYADYIDPDGVPYCTDHWKRYGDTWKAQRERFAPKTTKPTTEQGTLIG